MIHQYKNNGYNIVMDVNSGSVHVVDDVVYDVVPLVEEALAAGCPETEIKDWVCGRLQGGNAVSDAAGSKADSKDAGSRTAGSTDSKGIAGAALYGPEDIADAVEQVMELREAGMLYAPDIYENYITDFKKRETVVKALCLHIAHDCNLACKYCFAEEGEYHGGRALMSLEVGKKALDFLVKNSGNRVNLEVDFFGGEPP